MSMTESWDLGSQRSRCAGSDEPFGDRPAGEPGTRRPGRAGCRRRTPTPSSRVLGSMLLSKDAIADVNEVIGGADFYRPAHETIYDAIVDLYGRGEPADPVTVVGRAEPARRAAAGRRRAVPPHALGQRPDRRQRRLLRDDRAREGDPAPAGRRRHQDRAAGLRRRGRRRRRPSTSPSRRSTRSARSARRRTTRRCRAIMEGTLDEIEAISNQRRPARRRAHRVRRPRRADQRLHRRPDGDRRRAPGGRQVDAGAGLLSRRLDPQQPDQRDLQPGDVEERDHHAAALGRGQGAAQPHAQGRDERGRLEQAGPQDGPGLRARRCSSTTAPT